MNRKWLLSEDDYLKNNYNETNKETLVNYLGRTWVSIQTRASRLGLKKMSITLSNRELKIWDENSIDYLIKNYQNTDKEIIIKELNRDWSSIQNKAFNLKLKRDVLNANAINLINESNEVYYWLGFIMADGHFSKTNQLQINLAEKDLEHLKKFATFVEYKSKLNKPNISIGFSSIKEWLVDTFKISSVKSYQPCDLSKLSDDKLFSFSIGFIDGDGSISKRGVLTIKCHKSWLKNLNLMVSFLSKNDNILGKINSENLAIIHINKIDVLKNIKEKAIELGLPILSRKWDRIKESKMSKKSLTLKNKNICQELFDKELTIKEIINITQLSKSQIYKLKKEMSR